LENNDYVLQGPISLINMESGRKRRIYWWLNILSDGIDGVNWALKVNYSSF
jgi:hypothetical protein